MRQNMCIYIDSSIFQLLLLKELLHQTDLRPFESDTVHDPDKAIRRALIDEKSKAIIVSITA